MSEQAHPRHAVNTGTAVPGRARGRSPRRSIDTC